MTSNVVLCGFFFDFFFCVFCWFLVFFGGSMWKKPKNFRRFASVDKKIFRRYAPGKKNRWAAEHVQVGGPPPQPTRQGLTKALPGTAIPQP